MSEDYDYDEDLYRSYSQVCKDNAQLRADNTRLRAQVNPLVEMLGHFVDVAPEKLSIGNINNVYEVRVWKEHHEEAVKALAALEEASDGTDEAD